MANGNGHTAREQDERADLPPPREAIVEQGLRIQQETAAERDLLRREVSGLKSDMAGFKVAIEALQAQLADADSRVQSMTMVRDEAVLGSMLAIGRAFEIQSQPLIRERSDEDVSTMSANDRLVALAGVDLAGDPGHNPYGTGR